MQRRTARCLAALLALASLASLTSCTTKKKDGGANGSASRSGSKGAAGVPTITFTIDGGVDTNGTKDPDQATLTKVKATLDAYLAQAIVQPLATGKPAGDLSGLFTVAARPRLDDAETRATLVEGGLPPASRSISADSTLVKLSSVAGPDGAVALVGARLDLRLHAVGPHVDVDIAREGEIVLTEDDGAWRIDSFALRTTRNTRDPAAAGASTTTTTAGGGS